MCRFHYLGLGATLVLSLGSLACDNRYQQCDQCGDHPVSPPCVADADCSGGGYCDLSGTCQELPPCDCKGGCPGDLVCNATSGWCELPVVPPPSSQCTVDGDCQADEYCCEGTCKPKNSDDPDQQCCGGPCRPVDPTLTCTYDGECGGGDCVDGKCHSPCAADADCGTGDTCQGGFCWANPSPPIDCVFATDCGTDGAYTCINATCHLSCADDASCTNHADFCDMGVCQPDWRVVSECATNGDCTSPEQCVNGQCRQRCNEDADCALCQDGPRCVAGYCEQ